MSWNGSTTLTPYVGYERVPSAANVADGPSRGDKSDLEENLEIFVEVSDVLHALSLASP